MTKDQAQHLDVYRRVATFLAANPFPTPPDNYAAQLAIVQQAADQLAQLGGQQQTAVGLRRQRTQQLAAAMQQLEQHDLALIRRTARSLTSQIPAIDAPFLAPAKRGRRQAVLDAARAAATHVVAYKDLFVANGAPADFVDRLHAGIAAVEQLQTEQAGGQNQRVVAAATIETTVKAAHTALQLLDVMVRHAKSKDKVYMTGWKQARGLSLATASSGASTATSGTATAPASASAPPSAPGASAPTTATTAPGATNPAPAGTSPAPAA